MNEQLTGPQMAVRLLAQIGDEQSDAAIAAVHAVMDMGQPGELPDGLQLAIKVLLEESARNELIGAPESWNEELGGAIDAIRAEHAKRLTLQHRAADQAQRIADLEAKCCTLKDLHDAAADERDAAREVLRHVRYHANRHNLDRTWLKVADDVLGTFRPPRADAIVVSEVHDALKVARAALRARLAEIEAQEPAASVETSGNQGAGIGWTGAALPVGAKLYALPATAQAVPMSDERIDAIADLVIKSMPDGLRGFMRTWGYQQFARALLDVCAGYYRAVPAQAVPDVDELADARREGAEQMKAESAGREHSIGNLSALVETQRLLLVDVEDICGRDGHGGQFEDGESEIIDRIRAHLATMAEPESYPTPALDAADISDRLVAISSAIADSDDRKAQELLRETLKALAAELEQKA